MNEEPKIKTAIEFIKESNLFKFDKYNQLKPLMEKVLDDTITEEDIKKFVDCLSPWDEKKYDKGENLKESEQVEEYIENPAQEEELGGIRSIKEIKYVESVRLIDKIESIKLNDRVNIFYGLNASGKSSFYEAICNALGHEKETLPNINEDVNLDVPKCYLEVKDWEGKICHIMWQNGEVKKKLNVRIFDSNISLSLVQDDQDNTFSLAHLGQEYFQLLSEFLESLEDRLKERKSNLDHEFNLLEGNLQSKLPLLFEAGKEFKEEEITNVEISDEEINNLKKIQIEYEEMQRINFDDKIKILNKLIAEIEEILKIFGEKVESEKKFVCKYVFTKDYLERINDLTNQYVTCAKILHDKRTTRLKYYIPENWLRSDAWQRFIDGSFDFIRELSKAQQKEYLEKKCPYCHQILSERAKTIIENYEILQRETRQKISDISSKLNGYLDKTKKVLSYLEEFSKRENLVTEEMKEYSIERTHDVDVIVDIVARLKDALLEKYQLEYSQQDIDKVKAFFDHYSKIHSRILDKKIQYEEKNRNKEQAIDKLEIKMRPLEYKNGIVKNKEDLLRYVNLSDSFKEMKVVADLIIDAKTYVSRLGTSFSKEVFIKEFQKSLDEEYKNLNFCKPAKYQLSTRTAYGENKRVYRIGDKRIKAIFSEGEQKQHALADFFAQSEIEDFKGVFIFDDPVTSLDECNMEYLAERIIRLGSERNSQIIIFTHNLVFLNYLLELTGEEKVKHFTRVSNAIFLDPDAKLGTEHDLKIKDNKINERIRSLTQKKNSGLAIDEFEVRNTYDLLSGYLESLVEIKIFKGIISRYRPNIRINSLNKVNWDNDIISEIIRLYNKTSRKGSRHSQPLGIQTPTLDDLLEDKKDIDNLVL